MESYPADINQVSKSGSNPHEMLKHKRKQGKKKKHKNKNDKKEKPKKYKKKRKETPSLRLLCHLHYCPDQVRTDGIIWLASIPVGLWMPSNVLARPQNAEDSTISASWTPWTCRVRRSYSKAAHISA